MADVAADGSGTPPGGDGVGDGRPEPRSGPPALRRELIGDRLRRAGQVAWGVVGIAVLGALVATVAWWLRVIWPPLILAGAIVFVLNPVVSALERRRVPRVAGTALTYVGIAGVIVLIGVALWPMVRSQARDLADEWPHVRADIERFVDDLAARSAADDWPVRIPTYEELTGSFNGGGGAQDLGQTLETAREVGRQVFDVALIILLAPIIAFYLLVDLPHVRRVTEGLIPPYARDEVMLVARRLNGAIGGFFRGQLLVALIVGLIVSAGLAVIRLPFWLIVGMIAGVFNIIPLIGPWVGAVPGVVIALTTRDVTTAVWVAVVMAGAQQIDNHFISPVVMHRVVRLHPAAVMMALLAGGTLGGFFGLLLAVPTAAVAKIITGHLWRRYVLGEPLEVVASTWEAADTSPGVGFVDQIGDDLPPVEVGPEPPAGVSGAGPDGPRLPSG